MGEDEEGTLARLKAYREIIDSLISTHHGRVFGSAGDSVIAEFASPVVPPAASSRRSRVPPAGRVARLAWQVCPPSLPASRPS